MPRPPAGIRPSSSSPCPAATTATTPSSRSKPPSTPPTRSFLLPLNASNGKTYGLHPALSNVAALYNSGRAAVIANVGPLRQPVTKAQLQANAALAPAGLLSHPEGRAQWESASTVDIPDSGWGGRIADLLAPQSGSLPPRLDVGPASIFTVGRSVQAVAVQSSANSLVPLPSGIESAILAIAQADGASSNALVAQAGALRLASSRQQTVIDQARAAGAGLQTPFPGTGFGNTMKTVAQVIAGRSVVGASRQIFYTQQGGYDTHQDQLNIQPGLLSELDGGLGAFIRAMDELGLGNDVLVCTHSDFNRSMQPNSTGGTDHAWGNHQIIVGGLQGGQIYGAMPTLEIGGASDLGTQGLWIPTLSVTQMTAGIGAWMGLNSGQLTTVFPDLANFSQGALKFA